MTNSDKPKTPRHMISLTPEIFNSLDAFKAQLEKHLGIPLTYTQAVAWLINQQKEVK